MEEFSMNVVIGANVEAEPIAVINIKYNDFILTENQVDKAADKAAFHIAEIIREMLSKPYNT